MAESSNRQKDIFLQAIDLTSPNERAAFLSQACGADAPLRRQIESMLQAHATSDSFLEMPAAAMGPTVDELPRPPDEVAEAPGTRVGPYKLLQQVGEGGMGAVWMAEQMEPVRSKVALKLIKPGMDSAQVIARFEAERQALALMDHPNIAKVLDAGATSEGRPYFVMELVKGIAITKYCDDNQLTPRERLALMIPVCQAVQHAHQKGLIHRDLKPSNVLIACYDGKPVPKVIDFGVAKAMGQQLTERTLFTGFGGIVGTLEYMSPEQAEFNALDVDTRSDIYSLGVLLYELLTGGPPLSRKRLKEAALAEVLRLIREEEPPKPSTRLSESKDNLESLSAQRKLEPAQLAKGVRGELDWIVMKALEKDRGRRYETANGLAQEIERYLTDEPVQAGPPSAGYRLRKFVKRNRGTVTAAALVLTTLLAGIVGTSWGWVEALWQRDDAVQARKDEADQRKIAVKAMGDARDEALARAHAQENASKLAEKVIEAEKHKLIAEQAKIEAAKRQVRLIEAHLALEAGTTRCERGEIGPGLLWLARGLDVVPDDARDLNRSLRALLGGWSAQLHPVKAVLPLPNHLAGHAQQRRRFVSSDGKTVLINWVNGAYLWDTTTDKPVEPRVYQNNMATAALSPDGKTFLTVDFREAQLWDVATRKASGPPLLLKADANWSPSGDATFSPDGKKILIGGYISGAQLWDLVERKRIAILAGDGRDVDFSPDSRIAMTLGHAGVRLWDAETGKPLGPLLIHDNVENTALTLVGTFSADSKRIVTASPNGTARVWETASSKPIGGPLKTEQWVTTLAFSPDGNLVLTGSKYGREARLWNVDQTGAAKKGGGATGKLVGAPLAHLGPVYRVGFSPDGKTIETVSDYGVCRWDIAQPKSQQIGKGYVEALAFSPDGKTLVTANSVKRVRVERDEVLGAQRWDRATGAPIGGPIQHDGFGVYALAFSPDGALLATAGACDDKPMGLPGIHSIRLWDAVTGEEVGKRFVHQWRLSAVAFSRHENDLLTLGRSGFRRWDSKTGKLLAERKHDVHWLNSWPSHAFSPSGNYYFSKSSNYPQELKVWSAATGDVVFRLAAERGPIRGVIFDPPEKMLVSFIQPRFPQSVIR